MKLPDFSDPKSPTMGDILRGKVQLPLLMDSSSSCVSYLYDEEKDSHGGAGDITSAVVVPARNLLPLKPDRNAKEVGHPRLEIVPSILKRKSVSSRTGAESLIVEKKAKYHTTQKGKRLTSGCDTEEDRRNGVSTKLTLLFDPYKIKKKLTPSDLGNLSRLLIERGCVDNHLLRWMSEETVKQVDSGKGVEVVVRDMDTCSDHRLVFVLWVSCKSYVLKGGWIKEFVKRRGLAAGDEVGLYWDPSASKLHFSLLHKAN